MDIDRIIEGCRQKRPADRNLLYEYYSGILYRLALKYCANKEDAEDVLHDSFVIIFQTIKKYKGDGSFEGWMKRIVIFQSIKKYRSVMKWRSMPVLEIESEQETKSSEETQLNMHDVLQAGQDLPDQYRLVYNLYQFEGLSHAEIASMLKISTGTSKSNLHRAKEKLKTALNQIKESQIIQN